MHGLLVKHKVPFVLNQLKYSMFEHIAKEQMYFAQEACCGIIAFSPLAQGVLINKYIHGIPENSRASNHARYLKSDSISPETIERVKSINAIAD